MTSAAHTGTLVRPFRALHYDPRKVDPASVVSPPYDVISPEMRADLAAQSPYNVVRLILPGPGQEGDAGALLQRWRDEGIVVAEPRACLYWLEQRFTGPDGVERERGGIIGALRLTSYDDGPVRPHERTMEGPKAGRLALLRAVRANLSPVFAVYDDPAQRAAAAVAPHRAGPPVLDLRDGDGTRHRLWRICEAEAHAAIGEAMAGAAITIADGHHRYETALAYRDERRAADPGADGDQPYDFAPVYLVSMTDPGLHLFPTHRVVTRVEEDDWIALPDRLTALWRLEDVPGDVDALYGRLATAGDETAVAIWRGAGTPGMLARLRDPDAAGRALPNASDAMRGVDVAVAGALVLGDLLGLDPDAVATTDRIRYRRRADGAAQVVAAEPPRTAVALLLRAPTLQDVAAVAQAGETMPQKSTFFYPKILDGMVFHRLDETA